MRALIFIFSLLLTQNALALSIRDDPRWCGFVPRDESGNIKRNTSVLAKFQQIHPCPSTGLISGACPGWQIDHIYPLATGGCDSIINMQWLPVKIKTCADNSCKDRWERNIHEIPIETPGFKPLCCTYKIIKFE